MSSKPISTVICGDSITSSLVVEVAKSLSGLININDIWNNDKLNKSQSTTETFCNLLQRQNIDFIIMCSPPLIQLKITRKAFSYLHKLTRSNDSKSKNPVLILIPPVSPGYNSSALSDACNLMGIAMPMRKLSSVSVLYAHFKSIVDSYPRNNLRMTSQLPSYWILGSIQALHIRLNVTNPVPTDQYSWLCEPGLSGGGLLNLYGSGLIDLAYCLTNGLSIASVSCISRTFDPEINGQLNSIRRITAEDYVVIIAELESRLLNSRGPVAVITISSDAKKYTDSQTTNLTNAFNFLLNIELTGSSGRFVLPECGKKILWSPSRSKCTGSNQLNGNAEVDEKMSTNASKSPNCVNPDNNETTTSNFRSFSVSAPFTIKLWRDNLTEVATIFTKKASTGPCDSSTEETSTNLIREAWTRWFIELSSKRPNSSNKKPLDSLLATPEHWAYIQRVLFAIDKSTRLRRWVDVATGEVL